MENLQSIAVIIGIVNGVQLATLPDKKPFLFFLLAVAVGVVFGLLHYFGLTVEAGILAALASSGLYKVSQKIGGQ